MARRLWVLLVGQVLVLALGVGTAAMLLPTTRWELLADETRATTPAQEHAAIHCARWITTYEVLDSFPAQLVIHFRASSSGAHAALRCLSRSPGIADAGVQRG